MTSRSPNGSRLTPDRVRSMSFRLARLGHRGIDEEDVRDFRDQVEEELSRLLAERNALQREVHRLRSWARSHNQPGSRARNRAGTAPALPLGAPVATGGPGTWVAGPAGAIEARAAGPAETRAAGISGVPALPPGVGGHSLTPPRGIALGTPHCRHQDAHGQAVRILAMAQQTADQYVSDAHAYSREVAHEAQRRRERILAEASTRATVMLEQAHQAAVRAGLAVERGPARPAAAIPAPSAPVPAPAPPAPAPAAPAPAAPTPRRERDQSRSAEPAIYNAVVARFPHVAPVRRELEAGRGSGAPDSHRTPAHSDQDRDASAGQNRYAPAPTHSAPPALPGPASHARPPAHRQPTQHNRPTAYDPSARPGGPQAYDPSLAHHEPAPPHQPGMRDRSTAFPLPTASRRPASHRRSDRYPQPDRYPEPTGYSSPSGPSSRAPGHPNSGHPNSGYTLPPDYSTVIDYPGPAADYQPVRPAQHEAPGRVRDRLGRDRSGRGRDGQNRDGQNRDGQNRDRHRHDRPARDPLDPNHSHRDPFDRDRSGPDHDPFDPNRPQRDPFGRHQPGRDLSIRNGDWFTPDSNPYSDPCPDQGPGDSRFPF